MKCKWITVHVLLCESSSRCTNFHHVAKLHPEVGRVASDGPNQASTLHKALEYELAICACGAEKQNGRTHVPEADARG